MLINAAYEHAIYCKFRRVIKYVFILINDLGWAAIYLGGPDRGYVHDIIRIGKSFSMVFDHKVTFKIIVITRVNIFLIMQHEKLMQS